MSRVSEVLDRIQMVRGYTAELIDAVPESDWFRQPAEGVTHVGWQVGHLAMASTAWRWTLCGVSSRETTT